jgi:GNAT superfamily N-acetyltransferase
MDIIIKRLPAEDICRAGEIDRSEHITAGYVFKRGVLETQQVDWKVPRWSADQSAGFSVQVRIEDWKPLLEAGGVLLGAMDGRALVGMAIMRPDLSPGTAQLAALYIDRKYRRRGVASKLLAEVERLAVEAGAHNLYVSSIPSESAVGFYLSRGFIPTEDADPDLLQREPNDIHMIKRLTRPNRSGGK